MLLNQGALSRRALGLRGLFSRPAVVTAAVQHLSTFSPQNQVDNAVLYEGIKVGTPPLEAYKQLVDMGRVQEDRNQLIALQVLQSVFNDVSKIRSSSSPTKQAAPKKSGGMFGWLGGGHEEEAKAAVTSHATRGPRGAYLYGGVGSGKTMCMDLFFHTLPLANKRRVHFNQFMLDVHERLHHMRTQKKNEDHVHLVRDQLLAQGWLLCFDEFQVTDIGDAMILKRLFDSMFEKGAVVVATSNRPPDDLYKNGLQRSLFLPFIDTLKDRCAIHCVDSHTDYRLVGSRTPDVYQTPLGPASTNKLDKTFKTVTKGDDAHPSTLVALNRPIHIPRAAHGVARFTFDDLCRQPLSAVDYIAICKEYHTIFVDDIPQLNFVSTINEVRRFITFVDQVYEHRRKLVCSAETEPEKLFVPKEGESAGTTDEEFAYSRTVSRLIEMQSRDYLTIGVEAHVK